MTPRPPRVAYVVEAGFQHVFPVQAMLAAWPAPVFTPGRREAARLAPLTEVVHVDASRLSPALAERGIEVVISTSQRLGPPILKRACPRLRVVFIGHGESDKTHGQGSRPRPGFVHMAVNDEFDLIAVASRHHDRRYRNPHRVLCGYLKHDLFVAGGYGARQAEPDCVLWAPGWGRHCSVGPWLRAAVDATASLGLRLLVHPHPFSHVADARVVQEIQVEVIRHRHVRLAHCANVLDVMARARVMLGDVSSTTYDWLMFRRPILFLDHPGLTVEEEKALFPVGAHLRPGDDLRGALTRALAEPDEAATARDEALADRFAALDGRAAWRVREAILACWHQRWGHGGDA